MCGPETLHPETGHGSRSPSGDRAALGGLSESPRYYYLGRTCDSPWPCIPCTDAPAQCGAGPAAHLTAAGLRPHSDGLRPPRRSVCTARAAGPDGPSYLDTHPQSPQRSLRSLRLDRQALRQPAREYQGRMAEWVAARRLVAFCLFCLFVCGGLSETGGLPARMCEASRSPPPDCVAATHHAVRERPRKLRISITGDRGCPGPRAQPAMPSVASGRLVGVGWRTCSCSRSSRSCASCTIDRFACSFKFARPIVLSNQAWPQTQTQHARASQRVSECLSDARSSVQRDL
jgi:hypothetical protein